MPALPLEEAGRYVAAAYVVFVTLIVVYVAIMAVKLQRIERELKELADSTQQGRPGTPGREAEDVPVDSKTKHPTDSDRNLIPSESVGGRGGNDPGGGNV